MRQADIGRALGTKRNRVLAYVHSHSSHRYSILYQQSEYREVVSSQIPSYVVDTSGCVYGLFPEARGYTDYKVIGSRKAW